MNSTPAPQALDRRFEALVFAWDGTAVPDQAADVAALRAAVEGACALGLNVAILSGTDARSIDGQLGARPHGPGELHLLAGGGSDVFRATADDIELVEIDPNEQSDSAGWYFAHLWRCGIAAEQVLIVGEEIAPLIVGQAAGATVVSVAVEPAGIPEGVIAIGGGAPAFERLLDHQAALRRRGALPIVVSDPCWTFAVDGIDPQRERAQESLLTLVDGRTGTRGSVLAPTSASIPAVFLAGVYHGHGEHSELQPAPLWNRLSLRSRDTTVRRVLDLHAGVLTQRAPGEFSSLQFCSLAQPGLAVLRALAPRPALERSAPLVAPPHVHVETEQHGALMRVAVAEGVLESAAVQSIAGRDHEGTLDRIAAYVTIEPDDSSRPALRRVHQAREAGRERLLSDHRRAWAERWEQADVRIDGDPALQLAVRLALFHLIGCAADGGEAAVGARSLTGRGYRGHVFWDSDVFVLPFLAATHPAAARAILEYRVRRIPAAQQAARDAGHAGARFAWESAASGEDVTPRWARDRAGRRIAIYTGQREEHIVADVAWAAACYIDWTGDQEFREGSGKRLLVETARYWTSRAQRDDDGRAHIRGVIGPDEYHELVDDNAYTNVMARWNLRRAFAETTDADIDGAERAAWPELADALVDGYHPESGVYEEFAGFFDLQPLTIAETAMRRPIAADLLLTPEVVQRSQVVKQADVLMLHHLVPDELVAGSLAPNLAYYEPRTVHASSLSPGIHALLLARAGMLAPATAALTLTARIDLDDTSESSAGGVHIAAMGSLWQALVLGFGGARPRGDVLELDPRLPNEWESLEFRLSFRAAKLRVRIRAGATEVTADRPTKVSLPGTEPMLVGPHGHLWERP
ncbi:MAG: glycosyl hydrolase family 65 protein [Solirubrobacteraceae bacterium]|jgi:trehalose/maltose hydrolase-like predicted phosphorylase